MSKRKLYVTETFLPPMNEYEKKLAQIWDSKILTNRGPFVQELEEKIQEHLNSKVKPLAVNNGTIAIQLAIKALKLSGEIITTPFSYIATTSSVIWEQCEPIFVDIDPDKVVINADLIEEAITDKTSAILATHVFGNPCDVDKIDEIAKKHNLKVIYDAAHSFNTTYKGKSVFDYGDISTCSFHATKIFHTGEGGAIFCNDISLQKELFLTHNFGHDGPGIITSVGINGKLSDLQAAMGLCVLPYMPAILGNRKKAYEAYIEGLSFIGYSTITLRDQIEWNYSYIPIIFESEDKLNEVLTALNEEDIYPRRYFFPSLNELDFIAYKSCPISEEVSQKIICLPLSHGIENDEISKICDLINKFSS